jgi:hypothetical protein
MMDLFNLKGLAIAFGLGALLVLPAGYYVHRYDTDEATVRIDQQKQRAADELLTATNKTHAVEKQLAALGQQIEVTHNAAQQVLDDNARLNRQLVAARGLRDPGRRPSGASPVPEAGASGPAGVPAGGADDGRLSEVASGFLLDLTDRANRAGQYARDCREWAVKVSKRWNDAQAVSPASTPAQ